MKYLLSLRHARVGGAVVPGHLVQANQGGIQVGSEKELRLESNIVFLLHGFNVNRAAGTTNLLAMAEAMETTITPQRERAIVAVLWPGDHNVAALSYPVEARDADDSAAELARYIDRVIQPRAELSFVSHSLGARVVLEPVRRLAGKSFTVGQVCLMAPAIDDDSLAASRRYRKAVEQARRVAVLASRADRVLRWAYPAGDLVQSFLFWDDVASFALGYEGPKPAGDERVPSQVYHEQIPEDERVDHTDYVLNPNAEVEPQKRQKAAARFASHVVVGELRPSYLE